MPISKKPSLLEREAASSGFEHCVRNMYFALRIQPSDVNKLPNHPVTMVEMREIVKLEFQREYAKK
tara:strand:+ start:420 stop:617 length:198 start_codon:yes stop_codon:yes gene_type:complete